MNEIQLLHDVLLDNANAKLEDAIMAIEHKISEFKSFRHEKENVFDAVQIDEKDLKVPNLNLDKLSQQVEVLEQNFSKREIAFMLASLFRQTAMKSRASSLLDGLMGG